MDTTNKPTAKPSASPPAYPPRYLFVDVETTGLDPAKHQTLSIGWILCDVKLEVIKCHEAFFWLGDDYSEENDRRPKVTITPDEEALQINGYESWDTTKRSCRANVYAMLLKETPTGVVVAGHNVGFDIAMIDAECDRLGYRRFSKIVSHRKLDTQALAMADAAAGVLPSASLGAVVKRWPDLSGGPLHDALSDARTSLNIARHYVRRLWATEGIHAMSVTGAP